MHIVHLVSELAPIAKAGGLADVVFGLARATKSRGHTVDVILPKYDCLDYTGLRHLKPIFRELWSYDGPHRYHNTIWSADVQGINVFLLEPHHPGYFFSRGTIYGCPDDVDRFIYFSRAALEYLLKAGKHPDVLHLHDWPTAVAAVLYKEMYTPLGLQIKNTVLTIHNLQHQGKCSPQNLTAAGLSGEDFLTPSKMQDPFLPNHLNLLKGGIEYADSITTVSPTYEKEIQTIEGGCGLHTLLAKHQSKLKGILNGIDYDYWNPATDSHLPHRYTLKTATTGKQGNKKELRKRLGLKDSKGPLACCISRLVPQKGPELMRYALQKTLNQGGQCIVLGTTPHPDIAEEFQAVKHLVLHLNYDEALAHLTYAASDLIVIPSLFEPCGLTQMIALRYGCIPVVRRTGGLSDTIFDVDTSQKPLEERNGFVFDFPDHAGVDWALDRALKLYKDSAQWSNLVQRGMQCDFSWDKPAEEYLKVYGGEEVGREKKEIPPPISSSSVSPK